MVNPRLLASLTATNCSLGLIVKCTLLLSRLVRKYTFSIDLTSPSTNPAISPQDSLGSPDKQ